jgi:hypothetical protein
MTCFGDRMKLTREDIFWLAVFVLTIIAGAAIH